MSEMNVTVYEALQAKCRDIDTDVTAHNDDMRMLNACWPTIEAVIRDRDRLRLLIHDLHANAAIEVWP
jgi:hypothetical protein